MSRAQYEISVDPFRNVADVLKAKNPASLSGRVVSFPSAKVTEVLGRQVILVTDKNQTNQEPALLVRLTRPLEGLKPGSLLNIEGMLNQTPVQLQTWDINDTVAAKIRGHRVYVNVTKAHVVSPDPKRSAGVKPRRL